MFARDPDVLTGDRPLPDPTLVDLERIGALLARAADLRKHRLPVTGFAVPENFLPSMTHCEGLPITRGRDFAVLVGV